MSEQSEALRLADELQRNVIQTDHDDQVVLVPRWTVEGAIEEIRRQHARIEADEALMRKILHVIDQLVISVQNSTPDDACDESIDYAERSGVAAITALRSRLEPAAGQKENEG